MLDPVRKEIAAASRTVVVKVGTRVLTHEDGTLNQDQVTDLADQLVQLTNDKRSVVLVRSAATCKEKNKVPLLLLRFLFANITAEGDFYDSDS